MSQGWVAKRTEDDNVENEDNKPDESAAGSILPAIVQRLGRDGGREAKRGQAELQEDIRKESIENHGG